MQVVIVGGGLAGLAAAVALAGRGLQIELLEAKQSLGGRAGSFRDPETGELIDHCQHVAMGCCTNFLHFCARTGCSDLLERHQQLHFFSATGERTDFSAARWLPAPLHLAPALFAIKYLNWRDKIGIGRAMSALMRLRADSPQLRKNVADWLQQQRQTPAANERFWKVVLISALADGLENISLAAARKVFVDGFLAHRAAADVLIPRVPLGELYDERIAGWLLANGVQLQLGEAVKSIASDSSACLQVRTARREIAADQVVVAVPWKHVRELCDPALRESLPELASTERLGSSPISSVHLWTDRQVFDLPHAVLIDRLSQWIFARQDLAKSGEHYYQVVISASRELSGRSKEAVIEEVWSDLQGTFPPARTARLLRGRLLTQRDAVFVGPVGETPGMRAPQATSHPRLVLAGDWTATSWPATMEGAVRSGYLAAEQVLQRLGIPEQLLQLDLPRSWLARLLIR